MLHTDHEVVPCNCFYWLLALALYASLNEPLEGVDSFDVLLDPNDSVFDPHPGFQHRFVGLYSTKSDKFRSRSTCQHVVPAKLGAV